MTDLRTDAKTKVWYVPTISNQAAPTTSELNAGTALECLMTPDGLIGFEPSTTEIDNSSLCSDFSTKLPGRSEFSGTMVRLKKQAGSDTVYALLVRDLNGYIVIRRGTLSTIAWASSDKVEVYPTQTGETRNLPPEANGLQKYEVPFSITATPTLRAVVA